MVHGRMIVSVCLRIYRSISPLFARPRVLVLCSNADFLRYLNRRGPPRCSWRQAPVPMPQKPWLVLKHGFSNPLNHSFDRAFKGPSWKSSRESTLSRLPISTVSLSYDTAVDDSRLAVSSGPLADAFVAWRCCSGSENDLGFNRRRRPLSNDTELFYAKVLL